ncbi:MAG TPA: peptidoglycan DD-metalloendopeptidase family protein [Xanthobacteraceae bacterium]|nr:peptidoglycan DD-metalloendopeptidase family protein [Xanthobacteraceae bacterium]
MSAPNITVVVEPSDDGMTVFYEPTAPESANGQSAGVLCLMLAITNNGSQPIHLNEVTLSFPASSGVPTATIKVPTNYVPPTGTGVDIPPGGTMPWYFLRESFENDTVVLPQAAPGSMTLSLFFDGFTSPWTANKTLAPAQNPVTGNAYLYPAQTDDLLAGEFWQASSNTHGTGAFGSQLFAYDMNVLAWDSTINAINRLLPGKNGDNNADYRVWGKKLHAMADGTVLQFVNDCPNNVPPLASLYNGDPKHDQPLTDAQTAKYWGAYDAAHGGAGVAHAGAGNHFYIQHGNQVALYAHMQKGTLNANLLSVGATVKAGDFLGLAGNAGSSSEPHTHIHVVKGTQPETGPLRPLLFRNMFAIESSSLNLPGIAGPWSRLNVQGPPLGVTNVPILIWPLGRNPQWNGWEDLGGPIKAPPAVSSWAANRLDVFAAAADGKLNHKWWDGAKWHDWQTLGGTFQGGPAAVSRQSNRIDVFVQGNDNHLGHRWWDGSAWQGWEDLGGALTSAPAVASWAANRLDVFAAGSDGNLKHKWWDGAAWHDWQNIGGTFKGAPAAVSWGPNRIDVFVRGMDDHLGHRWWNGSQWSNWQDLGGPIGSAPAVAAWGSNRLDVFAAGSDGNLQHKWWDGANWSAWDWVGGYFQGNPAAVSWGPNRLDVFAWGNTQHLGHLWMG